MLKPNYIYFFTFHKGGKVYPKRFINYSVKKHGDSFTLTITKPIKKGGLELEDGEPVIMTVTGRKTLLIEGAKIEADKT